MRTQRNQHATDFLSLYNLLANRDANTPHAMAPQQSLGQATANGREIVAILNLRKVVRTLPKCACMTVKETTPVLLKPSSVSLKLKLPVLMVALTVAFVVTVSLLIYTMAERSIHEKVASAKESKAHAGAQALRFSIDAAQRDVSNLAALPTTFRAINNFERVIGMIEVDDKIGFLKTHYIVENPNTEEERAALVDPGDGSYYSQSHVTYHPTFVQTAELSGYSDIYLITPAGLVAYSVHKKGDFAENINDSVLADTALSRVTQAALAAEPGSVVVEDFSAYGPSGTVDAFLASPILNKRGDPVGVIAVRIGTDFVQSALNANLADDGYENIFLVDPDGRTKSPGMIADAFSLLSVLPNAPHIAAARAGEAGNFTDTVTALGTPATAVVVPLDLNGFDWSVVMETDSAQAFAVIYRIRWMVLSLIGASIVVSIGVSWAAANRVTRPIHQLRDATNALAQEDYDIAISGLSRGDEFGDLARSLDTFRDKLKRADEAAEREEEAKRETDFVVDEMSRALAQLQDGNLVSEIEHPFSEDYETLRENYNHSLQNLRNSLREVVEASQHVDRFSQEQRAAANEMAERTESQGSTLEKTATAMQDLSQRLRETAEKATEVDSTMRGTRREAEQSNEVVRSAVAAMDQIQQASSEIAKFINMIDDIAFQTNLLALNAGVEAARAGEAGAGFAVVASEVRNLARRASEAAGEIKTLTSASEEHVANGVSMVDKAGNALTSIIAQVSSVGDLVSEIAGGVQHQSQGLEDINTAMRELDAVTQQNTAMAEEASASSQLLQSEARTLSSVTGRFQIDPPMSTDAPASWDDGSDTPAASHEAAG